MFTPIGFFAPQGGQIVTAGLVGNFDIEDLSSYPGTGTTVFDLSPLGNDVTFGGSPTVQQSTSPYYLGFNGSTDYLQCASPGFGFGGTTNADITLEFWVYTTSDLSSTSARLFGMGGTGAAGSGRIFFGTNTGNRLQFAIGSITFTATTAGVPTQNTWEQWCIAHKGSTKTVEIYKNASLWDSGTHTNTVTLSTTADNLMKQKDPQTEYYPGNLSIARIYNTYLSSTDITQNFDAVKSRFGY
jgi:hypothetical protein